MRPDRLITPTFRDLPPPSQPAVLRTARGPVELVTAGEGPAVVSLHGAMGGWDQSLLLARTVAEGGYRHVALSRPGYLGTPLASGRSAGEQADLVAAALDALGIADAAVLAVSGGGPCALRFALRHPGRCRALVLVATCGDVIETRIPLRFALTRWLLRSPWLAGRMARRARASPEEAAARSMPDPALRARTLAHAEAGPLFRELLASTLDRPWLRLAGTENDIAVTRRERYLLQQIRAPALVVHGTADAVVPFRHARLLADRIPGAELLAVDAGEHVALFTHRDLVRASVCAFLRAHG